MTQISPIFQKELDLFRKQYTKNGELKKGMTITASMLESFLLQSLPRASMSVVEESVGEYRTNVGNRNSIQYDNNIVINANRANTLATAREIIGSKE